MLVVEEEVYLHLVLQILAHGELEDLAAVEMVEKMQ
jgi:hypothetical protein